MIDNLFITLPPGAIYLRIVDQMVVLSMGAFNDVFLVSWNGPLRTWYGPLSVVH
jgi:hypothetical protein